MIRTAVALAAKDSPDARAAAFRQLVDLSLQDRACEDSRLRWRGLRALWSLQREAPAGLRIVMIDSASRGGARALHVRLFRDDVSHHFDRLLQVARLDEAEWWRLARRAPAHLHAGMLARRDLPRPVRELLQSPLVTGAASRLFVADAEIAAGSGSIADRSRLAPPPLADDGRAALTPALDAGRSQVRELIDRIAAFRARAPDDEDRRAPAGPQAAVAPRWTWRCDETGAFVDSPDMPAQLLGHWITEFETPEDELSRAYERRVAFRDLQGAIADAAVMAGRWRLAGLPQFDRRTGRFTGYWGSAIALDIRQPLEAGPSQAAGLFGTGASGEALATMAHEVRTPLNAIIGFAQLIEGEILGEAGASYREQAGTILRHAEQLLGAFDDLSDAARIERGQFRIGTGRFDAEASSREVVGRYATLAADREVVLVPLVAADIADVHSDQSVFERALARLLTAALAAASAGETIFVVVQRAHGGTLQVAVSRPSATFGKSEDALTDPAAIAATGGSGPILGVGFGLKLVRSLAETVGGRFVLGERVFELIVPIDEAERGTEVS